MKLERVREVSLHAVKPDTAFLESFFPGGGLDFDVKEPRLPPVSPEEALRVAEKYLYEAPESIFEKKVFPSGELRFISESSPPSILPDASNVTVYFPRSPNSTGIKIEKPKAKTKVVINNMYAVLLIEKMNFLQDKKNLYYFNDKCWKRLDNDDFMRIVKSVLSPDSWSTLTASDYTEIRKQVSAFAEIMITSEQKKQMLKDAQNYICFENGVWDLRTDTMLPHSPHHLFFNTINANFFPCTEGGEFFEHYIAHCSRSDPDVRRGLLGFIGYAISTFIEAKSIFTFVSDKDSGKSTFGEFIEALLGEENVVSITVAELGERFNVAPLLHKRLAFDMDVSEVVWGKKMVGLLKKLTGRDEIMAEEKYMSPFKFKNAAALLLASNHIPQIDSRIDDPALEKRIKIIPFGTSIPDDEQDPDILEKLLNCRNYIITAALKELKALIANNLQFDMFETLADYKNDDYIVSTADHDGIVLKFIHNYCSLEPGTFTYTQDLYDKYLDFMNQENFHASPIALNQFGRKISALMSGQVIRQGKRDAKGFSGICLKSSDEGREESYEKY